jgi:hypothetical protein
VGDIERAFESRGPYMCRSGPARAGGTGLCPVNKKLCFTATDKDFLVALLHELSLREECFFVKVSAEPRDGMYLGRCFLVDEELLGRLWQTYKAHPKLMCSIQDDDYTARFRAEATG